MPQLSPESSTVNEDQGRMVITPVTQEDLDEFERISKASGIPVPRLLECALLDYLSSNNRKT